tara:strand:+ start:336 stop:1994 length:1659 start_codon:yes stop_codon:yes gene_type:complete
MSDKNSYYTKYLKYKQKYLELKGGELHDDIEVGTTSDKFDLSGIIIDKCYRTTDPQVIACYEKSDTSAFEYTNSYVFANELKERLEEFIPPDGLTKFNKYVDVIIEERIQKFTDADIIVLNDFNSKEFMYKWFKFIHTNIASYTYNSKIKATFDVVDTKINHDYSNIFRQSYSVMQILKLAKNKIDSKIFDNMFMGLPENEKEDLWKYLLMLATQVNIGRINDFGMELCEWKDKKFNLDDVFKVFFPQHLDKIEKIRVIFNSVDAFVPGTFEEAWFPINSHHSNNKLFNIFSILNAVVLLKNIKLPDHFYDKNFEYYIMGLLCLLRTDITSKQAYLKKEVFHKFDHKYKYIYFGGLINIGHYLDHCRPSLRWTSMWSNLTSYNHKLFYKNIICDCSTTKKNSDNANHNDNDFSISINNIITGLGITKYDHNSIKTIINKSPYLYFRDYITIKYQMEALNKFGFNIPIDATITSMDEQFQNIIHSNKVDYYPMINKTDSTCIKLISYDEKINIDIYNKQVDDFDKVIESVNGSKDDFINYLNFRRLDKFIEVN